MKRESFVLLSGILLLFIPFLGVPSAWKRVGYVAIGVLLIFIGYQLRRRAYLHSIAVSPLERKTDIYTESIAPPHAPSEHVSISKDIPGMVEQKVKRVRTKRL